MRKIVASEFMTLDGVMEAPGGEPGHPFSGWAREFAGPEQLRYKLDEVLGAEALLVGRITYESLAAAWPERARPEGDPDIARVVEERSDMEQLADRMSSMPKHVVSRTLHEAPWRNSHLVRGDVAEEVRLLKRLDGGPILLSGSRTLLHALMEHDLVDEFRVMVFPVLLGSGRRLFPDAPYRTALRLADTRVFATGVAVHTWQRVDEPGGGRQH